MEDSSRNTGEVGRGPARVEVGCQGWNYEDWVTPAAWPKAVFYPRGTRADRMLEIYARAFETVEVDSTFYATPSASTVEGWKRRTPEGFTFSLKLPREITHEQALKGEIAARVLKEFCERARLLGEKLAAVLVQLPPQFEATKENSLALAAFLPLLPTDIRFAFEFRDPFWFDAELLEIFTRHPHATLALVEGLWVTRGRVWRAAEKILDATDFAYVRWMGARDLTRFDLVQRPQDANLDQWAEAIEQLSRRVPRVSAYFSNFYEGFAPASVNKLKRLLGQETVEPDELENQPTLF
ncbi:MAG TPA: DUF72 domain-containing protein [Pyrinomonadaceae bacterium]|nr:DUF72 domain-containing protein [Pyrinomonadaceae bacterium]